MRRTLLAATTLLTHSLIALAQAPARSNADDDRRVESLLSRMTLDEKIGLIAGVHGFDIPGLARLGIPELGTADSPFGVRAQGQSTLYAGGINLAATWNPALAQRVGTQLGRDARARGRHYSLGPGVNIYRSPLNGRNFEYYGEDPWLASRIAVGFIEGVQSQNVSTTIKHFMGNNSEFGRNWADSRIDERTLREIYLPVFEAAVKEAHTGAIMNSYNLTNGTHMSENRPLLVDLVKNEWGFPGVIMSDWFATHNAVASANAGQDIEMPFPIYFNRDSLLPAITRGTVAVATIDDKVRRLLRNQVRFGWLERWQPDESIPRYNPQGKEAALQAAREGMVLLKNEGGTLPLDRRRVKNIALIGPNAYPAVPLGGGSATIPPYHAVSPLEGLVNYLGTDANVHHVRGIPSLGSVALNTSFATAPNGGQHGLNTEVFYSAETMGQPGSTRVDQRIALGAPLDLTVLSREDAALDPLPYIGPPGAVTHRWTGYYEPRHAGTYDFVVQQGGFSESGYRLFVDGKVIADRWRLSPAIVETLSLPLDSGSHRVVFEHHSVAGFGSPFVRMGIVRQGEWVDSSAVAAARRADVVILAVGFDPQTETENWDRTFRLPPGQDELIQKVVAANPRTVVVVNSGGAVDMNGWIDRVPALVEAWYPGQEGGTGLAEILFGEVNPSGHLPATFERHWEDNPVFANYYPDSGTNRITYREGVFVGYRGYERRGIVPRFPFGHGLSYTTFRYANLNVLPAAQSSAMAPRWSVTFDVTNTGSRAGAAVPQLYVHERTARIPRPAKELKGFAKVTLQPGETQRVTIPLDFRSLAYYDAAAKQWRADAGIFDVLLGASSADSDIALRAPLTLQRTLTAK
jgi:beta-glucosidase